MDENMNYTPTPEETPASAPEIAPAAEPVFTAPAEPTPNAAPVYTAPGTAPAAPAPAKKLPLVPILIAAAVVVAAICAAVFFITRNSASAVAERYILGCFKDEKAATALQAYDYNAYRLVDYDGDEEAFFEYASETFDADITSWNDYYKAVDDDFKESLEEVYGEYKVTAKVLKSKDISVKRVLEEKESLIELLENDINFDSDKISDAKLVTVRLKIAGEDGIRRNKYEVYVVKIGLSWRVLARDFVND